MTDPSDLTSATAYELAQSIAEGIVSASDVMNACLARIDAIEDDIGAFIHLDREHALTLAEAADAARQSGQALGPLHGVPVGLKDIIETADIPTGHGSPIFDGHQPVADATLVTALKQAGAVMIGKTVTTELAVMHPGKTRNPHNQDHTPGGSSSGSAAGVAAHMFPAAIGSQTGGSILRPSSFCGVYGFKPTHGRVPRTGVITQSLTLDTMGPITRSIDDCALLAQAMFVHDDRDPSMHVARPGGDLLSVSRQSPPAKPKLAFVRTANWNEAEAVTQHAFEELVQKLGTQAVEIDLTEITKEAADNQTIIQLAEIGCNYGPLHDAYPGKVSESLVERIEKGRAITAPTYIQAINRRRDLNQDLSEQIFDRFDAILTPASPGPAPLTLANTGNPIFNGLWTYLGLPAISLPLFSDANDLPFGAQLVGAAYDDARLLRTARWLEQTLSTS